MPLCRSSVRVILFLHWIQITFMAAPPRGRGFFDTRVRALWLLDFPLYLIADLEGLIALLKAFGYSKA